MIYKRTKTRCSTVGEQSSETSRRKRDKVWEDEIGNTVRKRSQQKASAVEKVQTPKTGEGEEKRVWVVSKQSTQ